LHLPESFIEKAYAIRNKYFPDMRGDLSAETSRYNIRKLKGICELCREETASEIHHIQEQKMADEVGRIGSIHKNHPANLLALCESCHQLQHSFSSLDKKKPKIIKKKTTKGMILENNIT
jgi:hypothetical protein